MTKETTKVKWIAGESPALAAPNGPAYGLGDDGKLYVCHAYRGYADNLNRWQGSEVAKATPWREATPAQAADCARLLLASRDNWKALCQRAEEELYAEGVMPHCGNCRPIPGETSREGFRYHFPKPA